jgi:hypothetical protein
MEGTVMNFCIYLTWWVREMPVVKVVDEQAGFCCGSVRVDFSSSTDHSGGNACCR